MNRWLLKTRLLSTLEDLRSSATQKTGCRRRLITSRPKSWSQEWPAPFDAREATVSSVQDALFSKRISCRDIAQSFLARIEAHDWKLNSIIAINPNILEEASRLDGLLATSKAFGLLFGVPILLKDNFDAVGMPTTAGSLALKDVWPSEDAEVVTALRTSGALILGKTNLHEFALEGLSVSSHGGQTLNPYDFTRTPGGSSGGSSAAVAASFAVMATGTDTVNSLRNPASANSLYSFRPTPGLISRKGIVPVSFTQDAVGMIGRSLSDIAIALQVMANPDKLEANNGDYRRLSGNTSQASHHLPSIPTSKPLAAYRIGVLHSFMDSNTSPEIDPVNNAMSDVQHLVHNAGASLISIRNVKSFNAPQILSNMDLQTYEIRTALDEYLSSSTLSGTFPRTFAELFDTRGSSTMAVDPRFLIIPHQYEYIQSALTRSPGDRSYSQRLSLIRDLTRTLHTTFSEHSLDCLIYPQQQNLPVRVGANSQTGRNGILAAVTGSPVLCIPIGFSPPTDTAPIGLPIGMEILGLPGTESKLLDVARGIDTLMNARKPPVTAGLSDHVEAHRSYEHVIKIRPRGLSSVDTNAYPPGRISRLGTEGS